MSFGSAETVELYFLSLYNNFSVYYSFALESNLLSINKATPTFY